MNKYRKSSNNPRGPTSQTIFWGGSAVKKHGESRQPMIIGENKYEAFINIDEHPMGAYSMVGACFAKLNLCGGSFEGVYSRF